MSYNLFIDDERFPPADSREWVVARTMREVLAVVKARGWPNFVSFDHDLGDTEPSGFDITKWMVEQDLNGNVLPSDFSFYVHSQNPVGKQNIEGLLGQYLKHRMA